ncbi:MAG: hypothetical protein JXR25_13545 [Pontiellaceae bacterium]|nr:hypothetical protein [Pontiellaceae bacterium]MBN2785840.1 hypothetical protein [Pontiellaceae bacterium]
MTFKQRAADVCRFMQPAAFGKTQILWTLTGVLLAGCGSVHALSSHEADTMAGAFSSEFYVQNGSQGYFKDTQTGGITYFWGQAEMIETVIDAYEWSGDERHLDMCVNLLNGFLQREGTSWSWNIYNDDIMWAVLAFARVAMHTGDTYFASIAKSNFDMCYARAWDTVLGGGIYWTTDKGSKNACSNGNTAIAAYLLYQIYGDSAYLDKANAVYDWERATLFNPATGAVYDSIGTGGNINTWASTYNQGTFIGAAHFLGHTEDAKMAANFTLVQMSSSGILPQYGIAGNNSGFNAIFLRWMNRFIKDRDLQDQYGPWLQKNAAAAWNIRRSDNLSWCQWREQSPSDINFYAWDCISSYSSLYAADFTQSQSDYPVPRYPAGYWPLDESSGTVADDAAENSDGIVTDGTWSNGRVNGCLTFNGTSTKVETENPLCNDFSIAFWVKTTQSITGSQWYQGAGLVDADVAYTKDDFGTALLNGRFAFGIGNPDMTIQSTSTINNGNWHQCVATREQATGTIRVYVDGNLEASGSGNKNSLSASTSLLFGVTGSRFLNGSMDEIQIFTRTLSDNEVAALYYSRTHAPMSAPADLKAIPGNGQVNLEWKDAGGATAYNIKRSLVVGGPYTTVATVDSTSYTDTDLANNRTYYYVVSGANDIAESEVSAEVSVNPTALVTWLKADSLTNLSNGADVSVWSDASGNGNNATQPIDANKPSLIDNAINGKPAVRFNAADKSYLTISRPVQDDFTMVVVYQSSQGIGTGTGFYTGAGLISGEYAGTVNDFGVSLNANGSVLAGVGNPDLSIHSANGFNDGQPHVVTFIRTKSSGTIRLFVDGAQVYSTSGGTQSLTAPNVLMLGSHPVLNNYLTGDIAEVRIFSRVLSSTEMIYQERALRYSYGITGGSVPGISNELTGTADDGKVLLNWTMAPGASSYNIWRSSDGGATYVLIATELTNTSYVDATAAGNQDNLYRLEGVNECGAGSQTLPTSVYVIHPRLALSTDSGAMEMRWESWADDWQLYGATNLATPIIWQPLSDEPVADEGEFSVSVPMESPYHFFRLSRP